MGERAFHTERMNGVDDRTIVRKFRERDEDAVALAKNKYRDYCVHIARNVLCDSRDAEECLNDALLAAWKSIPPNEPENLRTYLGKLTREIAINRWKTNSRKKRVRSEFVQSLDEIAETTAGGDVESEIEGRELSRAISNFLYSIDETKRNVFIRRYWYLDSVADICDGFGFKKSKVLMMLKRTRDDLAEHLKKEGYIK